MKGSARRAVSAQSGWGYSEADAYHLTMQGHHRPCWWPLEHESSEVGSEEDSEDGEDVMICSGSGSKAARDAELVFAAHDLRRAGRPTVAPFFFPPLFLGLKHGQVRFAGGLAIYPLCAPLD